MSVGPTTMTPKVSPEYSETQDFEHQNELNNFSGDTRSNPRQGGTLVEFVATFCSLILLILTLPIAIFFCFKVTQDHERAVIFRLGRICRRGTRGPGIFFILPCIDTYRTVDLRTISCDFNLQDVVTRDAVAVTVAGVVSYRVVDPILAVSKVVDYNQSTRLAAAATIREVYATKTSTEIRSDRKSISRSIQLLLDKTTKSWGINTEGVEMKDMRVAIGVKATTTLKET